MRKPSPFSVLSSIRKFFADNFERGNTSNDLGITSTGSRWDQWRGIFKVQASKAISDSSPSSYPMATVNMPFQDVEISLKDIDSGAGAALWVTDSGDWWGIGLQQEEVDCNCEQGTECNRWNARNCAQWNGQQCFRWGCRTGAWTGSTNTGQCTRWSRGNCRRFAQTGGGNCRVFSGTGTSICVAWNTRIFGCVQWNTGICQATRWNANTCTSFVCQAANAGNCRSFNSQTCNRWFEFTTNCETCYPQYIRIFRSVNSTVSTVFSAVITRTFQVISSTYGSLTLFIQPDREAPRARSMKVKTTSDSVSADVFSDSAHNQQIIVDETITYGPTGVEIPTTYGIMVNPSSYNQNNYIGEINIDKN